MTWSRGGRMVRSWRVDWTCRWAGVRGECGGGGRGERCAGKGVYTGCVVNCYLRNDSSLFYPIKLQTYVSLKGNKCTENKSVI